MEQIQTEELVQDVPTLQLQPEIDTLLNLADLISTRIAIASGEIQMSQEAYDAIIANNTKKGPVLQTAVIASIMGVKKTSELANESKSKTANARTEIFVNRQ